MKGTQNAKMMAAQGEIDADLMNEDDNYYVVVDDDGNNILLKEVPDESVTVDGGFVTTLKDGDSVAQFSIGGDGKDAVARWCGDENSLYAICDAAIDDTIPSELLRKHSFIALRQVN